MWSLQLIVFPIYATQFSGCTAGISSQADDDCPEPPEVLVSKEACCILVGNVSLGLRLPPSRPYGSGCLSPEGDGLQPALSVLSFILWVVLAESYVRAFCVVGFPPSGLLAQVSSLWIYCWACNLLVLFIYLFIFPSCYASFCASKACH